MICQYQKEQEMKGIPARYIPTACRLELAGILDPPNDFSIDRDYRFFAEKNKILPEKWRFLDSQKVIGRTSSFCNILDYLIDRDGDQFTVFTVYKTLLEMKVRGTEVLDYFMPAIKELYKRHTRSGEENKEEVSCTCAECQQINKLNIPPDNACSYFEPTPDTPNDTDRNNLDIPSRDFKNQPLRVDITSLASRKQISGTSYMNPADNLSSPTRNQNGCRSDCISHLPCTDKQCRFHFSGWFTDNRNVTSHLSDNHFEQDSFTHTYFEENLIPPSECMSSISEEPNTDVNIRPHLTGHITPFKRQTSDESFHNFGRTVTYKSMCSSHSLPDSLYESTKFYADSRPYSEIIPCNHQGACNCCKVHSKLPASVQTQEYKQQSSASAKYHTVSTPIQGMNILLNGRLRRYNEEPLLPFVLVLGGDDNENGLREEIYHLKQVLNSHGILSVTVCSYEQKPLVSLTNQHLQVLPKLGDDWKSCEDFTKECYFKAQAVIVALSPGYLEYAEEFRHGAKSSASKQQEIIRWLHEKIKDEHIAQHRKPKSEMNSRFLPLLLKKMNAVEKHMPDIFKTMKWKKFANKNDKWLESLKKKLANKFLKERET